MPQRDRPPTNQMEFRNYLRLERDRQGELAAETSRPRSPSEIQVIDLDLNSTRASFTENKHIKSTSTTLHLPVHPNLLQDLSSPANHCQTPNGTMIQDGCDQMPSASSSQSVLGAGRATAATAGLEELQLQLSKLKI